MLELAAIVILGILAQWFAWRFRVPAILPLIITGLIVGPISTLWTSSGQKWIEPIFDGENGLFPGESLFYFVSLAIGIILFEGGMTLKRVEIRGVGTAILRLIIIGSVVTFIGAGIAAHFLVGLSWKMAFLFAGLIIVTGPTVIAPILRNIPLNKNVATVLKWEGILIDPLGALVAVLVFEFIVSGGEEFTQHALFQFGKIITIGVLIGAVAAYFLYYIIRRQWLPRYLLNVFTLALVLMVFVLSDVLAAESGLLSVVIMGMILGNLEVPNFKQILDFKESLSILLISVLFILLAANINLEDLNLLRNINCAILFVVVAFVLRPIGVFLSTIGSDLNGREKIFISWVGPRGIVAAGIASLFGLRLTLDGVADAHWITPLVFMIVLGTVLINATTARWLAKLLKVIQSASDGILIIGSNLASRFLAKYLKEKNRHVILVDNNPNSISEAKQAGLEAVQANVYTEDLNEHFEMLDMGYLMAMTSNTPLNQFVINTMSTSFGEMGTFRLPSSAEVKEEKQDATALFAPYADFINLIEVVRDKPEMHELPVGSLEDVLHQVRQMKPGEQIPVFYQDKDQTLHIFPASVEVLKSMPPPAVLIYVGSELTH